MYQSRFWTFLLLAASAIMVRRRSFAFGQAAQRWPPRVPTPLQGVGQRHSGDGVADSDNRQSQGSPFPVLSTAGNVAVESSSWPRRRPFPVPFTANEAAPLSLSSALSMVSIVAAERWLRTIFSRLGWTFPSSVAGMISLFAGLAGLNRVSPSRAETLMKILEPGSTQIMAWLPLIYVPVLIPFFGTPLGGWVGSFESLPEAVAALAKLGGIGSNVFPSAAPTPAARGGLRARGTKFRVAVNITKLLLTFGGGWLMSFGSAAALFTVLSPTSSSPASSCALSTAGAATSDAAASAAAVAGFPSPKTPGPARAAAGLSHWRLVRWLGAGTLVSGAFSLASFAVIGLRVTSGWPWNPNSLGWEPLFFGPGIYSGFLMIGLAAMFGFAAGRTGLSSWDPFGPSCSPWTAMLLPVAPSMAAALAVCATFDRMTWMALMPFLDFFFPRYMHWTLGTTDFLLPFFGPAIFSFAPSLFRMRGLIFSHARQVVGGSIACASSALFGIALGFRLLGVPKAFDKILQPKAPSSAISKLSNALKLISPWHEHKAPPSKAITVASALGFSAPSMIAGVLALTGLFGAALGTRVLDAMGVKDPMTRGLIQGGTLDVFGVAALYRDATAEEPLTTTTEASRLTRDVSTVTMILTGIAGTVMLNIPAIRSLLLSIALGPGTAGSVMPIPSEALKPRK